MTGVVGSFYNLVPGEVRLDPWGNPLPERETYTDVVVVGRAHSFRRKVYGTSIDPDSPAHPRWRLPGARYPIPSPQDPGFRGKGR